MTRTLDWKWIGIGVVVMVVLNFIAGLTLGLFLAPQLEAVASPENVELSGGQIGNRRGAQLPRLRHRRLHRRTQVGGTDDPGAGHLGRRRRADRAPDLGHTSQS